MRTRHNKIQNNIVANKKWKLGVIILGVSVLLFAYNTIAFAQATTIYIKNDSTGGDCLLIGTWDSSTRTCVLTRDLVSTSNVGIRIEGSGITLDGALHLVSGNYTQNNSFGVIINGNSNRVKNIIVQGFTTGITLYSVNNNIISDVTLQSNQNGITLLAYSNSNHLVRVIVQNNTSVGIMINTSNFNTIVDSLAKNNSIGIVVAFGSNNIISKNISIGNQGGIILQDTDANQFLSNSVHDNYSGIQIGRSGKNTFRDNSIKGSVENFELSGVTDVHFDNIIDTTNTVENKVIYYLQGARDQTFDASTNAGLFYCINCSNIVVKDLFLSKNGIGIFLRNTTGARVENVSASHNTIGVLLSGSDRNIITTTTLTFNRQSVSLYNSNDNVLSNNVITDSKYGIYASLSNRNHIIENLIEKNISADAILLTSSNANIVNNNTMSYGVTFLNAKDNQIYNNNLIGDNFRINNQTNDTVNVFNLQWPIGGNYWSKYSTQSQGCYDVDKNSFCDEPLNIYSAPRGTAVLVGKDNLPWILRDGWVGFDPTITPISFLSQVKNAPNLWNLRKTYGTTNKPADDVIKTVPNDWVLKVATTTDSMGRLFEIDGFRWYGVVDVTDSAVGWMVAEDLMIGTEYLSYDASAQTSLEEKVSTALYITKESRVPVILQAVDTYHTETNASSSLYSGGGGSDGNNNFQKFIQGSTFPQELVLAIISQESVSINFDNEGCSSNLDGGIGIMQITSLDARGSGSSLKNYPKMDDCMEVSTSKYYSNAWQGIFANIKDGFRTLQDKFGYVRKTEAVDNITEQEMKAVSTVYRYNQGSPYKVQAVYEIWNGQSDDYVWNEYLKYIYKNRIRTATADSWMQKIRDVCASETTFKNCLVKTESAGMTTSAFYLRDVGNKLHSSPFGSSYQNPTYGDKLIAANNSRLVLFLRSPAELRVVNSVGEITGSVAGEPMEEIANSVYVPEQKFVTIFFPRAQYKYRVVGLETGEYGLSADFINNGDHTFFDADYIPTHSGEIHDYTIDWNKMSRCERGSVLLEVDYEGDGIVDRVVKGSCRLSDINPPAITISSPSGSYLLNATTTVQFTATDASGIGAINATLNGVSVTSGQIVTLIKPGENTLEVSAIDAEGNISSTTTTFNVLYTVNGFLQPIKSGGGGVYNQGMTLPVRFEVRDVNGKVVSAVSAQLYIAKVNNGVVSNDEIPASTTATDTGNQFRYDAGGHMYIFNLSTDAISLGTWQMRAVLDSGQEIKANVQIRSK